MSSQQLQRPVKAGNFGDYYTRRGCKPQLTSHAKDNMNIGNDKAFLINIISQRNGRIMIEFLIFAVIDLFSFRAFAADEMRSPKSENWPSI